MKNLLLIISFFMFITGLNAQTVIKLWEANPPTNNGLEEDSTPEMIVYLPEKDINKKMAVIICPSGGYSHLAMDHEGHQFAKWLQTQGFASIVLKYRMPNNHKEIPLEDFQQAMRYVRSKAVEWDLVDADMESKIGVAGFSAGAHLATTACANYESNELRPDFSVLFYPVITMGQYANEESRNNLLGENRTANDILFYSNETRINEHTPPAILLLSDDDEDVSPLNSIMYYEGLKENKIPAAMYIFPEGGHGWGMNTSFKYHNEMLSLLGAWLEDL